MSRIKEGEYVIYHNGERYELGRVARVCSDGAFVCYSEGETAAKTSFEDMHPLVNGYCIKGTNIGGERWGWER